MSIKKFGNADKNNILLFEQKYNLKLPNDYINFLFNFNGGDVNPDKNSEVYVRFLRQNINVDVLFGINTKNPELGIELWMNDYKREIPDDTIIIGASYQHGLIVMLCSGDDAGIYYWDHTYEYECSNNDNNTFFIADTFTDFAKNLLQE